MSAGALLRRLTVLVPGAQPPEEPPPHSHLPLGSVTSLLGGNGVGVPITQGMHSPPSVLRKVLNTHL